MPGGEHEGADNPLLVTLRARIRRDGPLPVDQYMAACLTDPEHGYWRRAASIGTDGDFITAPEISQIFGELIGMWCAVVWQGLGRPAPLRLVELGPGRGTLLHDALRAARKVPGFSDALSVHLVEISSTLRETQRDLLVEGSPPAALGIKWHETLDDVPEGPAIIIANEFLDALPVRQAVLHDSTWRERVVDVDADGALRFALGPATLDMRGETSGTPNDGDIVEMRPGESRLLAQLARRSEPVVALFIDYGPLDATIGDTLQGVRRHRYVDPLSTPGSADLTAHVQFARLARQAHAAGLATDGPMLQAEFLGRLGIAERAARLMAANPGRAGDIEAAVQRLISPTGMGQLFKVLAVRSPELTPMPPFG